MKSAGWSTRRVVGQVNRSECAVRNCWEQWIKKYPRVGKPGSGATRKTTRREDRRIVRQAPCNPHSDSFNDTSRRRRSNCSTNNFQTPCQRYVEDILRTPCRTFLNGLPGAIFQQHNAFRIQQELLKTSGRHFQTLPWPARSPICPL
ncbi:uncharacterized protein TNCV_499831 [Trichonephila clavipes]|nr:uncharacterized protein TNCV_499831 [Trichonephila clavipes]